MRRKKRIQDDSMPLFEHIKNKKREARDAVVFYSELKKFVDELKGKESLLKIKCLSPAGSFLDRLVDLFWSYTDIPVSLAYWGGLTSMGAYMASGEKSVNLGFQEIDPNLWTIILSDSGSGKTWLNNFLVDVIKDDVDIVTGSFTSKAALIDELKNRSGRGLIIRDEVGQQMKLMKSPTYITLKDAMLSLYDGKLEHRTKKDGLVVLDNLAMSYFGTTVTKTFSDAITEEDILDGFLQRFTLYLSKDSERNMKNWPYIIPKETVGLLQTNFKNWTEIVNSIDRFELSNDALKLWKDWYLNNFKRNIESYYKRYMFAGVKYAAIYNTLIEKNGIISIEDMSWAIRLVEVSLESLCNIMENHLGFNKWEKSLSRLNDYFSKNPNATPRTLMTNLKYTKHHLLYVVRQMFIPRYGEERLNPEFRVWLNKNKT